MAKTLSNSGITTNDTIRAGHVTQSIDALTGTDAYDITISGSLTSTGNLINTGGYALFVRSSSIPNSVLNVRQEGSGSIAEFGGIEIADQEQIVFNLGGHITASGNVSSSAVSTASFGTYLGDGSQLTNLQRPISNSVSTNVTASNLNSGYYFRTGGNITCSIQSNAIVSCDVGSEFEFFQTSSAGNLLFHTGSGVTLNSKNGSTKLSNQFSAATLKKIDTNEWDLIGDLS